MINVVLFFVMGAISVGAFLASFLVWYRSGQEMTEAATWLAVISVAAFPVAIFHGVHLWLFVRQQARVPEPVQDARAYRRSKRNRKAGRRGRT